MQNFLTLALAAGAAALPSAKVARSLSNAEFGLVMNVSPTETPNYVSLNVAKQDGTDTYILIGQRLSVYPGTPVYLVDGGSDPDFKALDADVNGCSYGLYAADIGHTEGTKTYVTATEGQQQFAWAVGDDGSVNHQLYAATNLFLACNATVGGETYLALGWGTMDEVGNLPEGCQTTSVRQNCNIEGSQAAGCT